MTAPAELSEFAGLSRQERVEQLRRKIAAVPSRGESVAEPAPMNSSSGDVLAVPPALAALLPRGGLARGSVVSYSGAGSLLLGMLASVTAAGGHAVVIGKPRLGLLAAAEMGAQLQRIALVPDPGPDPVEVAAVLLDGLDLVVLNLDGASVPPSRARAVVARARSKKSTLVVTGGHWAGAELSLDSRVVGYEGLGRGSGRVRSLQLEVHVRGRGFGARPARMDLQPARDSGIRLEWAAAADNVVSVAR